MVTVSLVLSGEAIGTISTGFTISDIDAGRIMQWAMDNYPDPNEGIPDSPPWSPVNSLEQVAHRSLEDILTKVVAYEKDRAARQAVAGITDIRPQ